MINKLSDNFYCIDLNLQNKLYGPMHFKIGVTCVFNGHVFYTIIIQQSIPPIPKFNRPCNEFTSVWSVFLCNLINVV